VDGLRMPNPDAESVRVLRGPDLLERLGSDLDALLAATGAPITARRPWLQAWANAYGSYEPLAVAVGGPGVLRAAALLAVRSRHGVREVVGLGHEMSDQVRLPATDPGSARTLGRSVARALRSLGRWSLRIEQLPPDDPAVAALAASLPRSAIVPGDPSPFRPLDSRTLNDYLSRNTRGAANQARNRAAREGLPLEVKLLREPREVAAVLPEMERVRRLRDASLARRSDLEDPARNAFWHGVIKDLTALGSAEVVTVLLGQRLAAYCVNLLDGDAYRVWDARFEPDFARFRPGTLAEHAGLESALSHPQIHVFDWMRGDEPHKFKICTELAPAVHLLAWSSPGVWLQSEGPRRSLSALRLFRDRHPGLKRAWTRVKSRTIARPPT